MTRFQGAFWLTFIFVTLVAFGLAVPTLPSLGPATRVLTADDTMELTMASVTIPAGWEVDIASAAQGRPEAVQGNVTIGIADALWLGGSSRLVERVAGMVFSEETTLPDVPADANGEDSEKWEIFPAPDAAAGDPRRLIVLRRDTSVVLVVVRGPASEVEALAGSVDSIVASVEFVGLSPTVGGPS